MNDIMKSNRVHLIDEIRGFAIICMVVYHTFFDLVITFDVNIPLFHSSFVQTLVVLFVFIFVFISGSACAFSRSNLKRGLLCLGLGLVMTAVTYFFIPSLLIVFGILHMLGTSMILYALLSRFLIKIPSVALIIGGLLLFFITYHVPDGYLGFESIFTIGLPSQLYDLGFLFPLGFISNSFYSSDYFSLFPWFFCFVAGSSFGRLLKDNKMPNVFYQMHLKPLAFVGRHTLIIYILHQPIVFLILSLIFSLIR